MKISEQIKVWPSKKKNIFALMIAVFLTILIIILWLTVDFYLKKDNIDDTKTGDSLNKIKDSFLNIFKDLDTNISTTSTSTNQ